MLKFKKLTETAVIPTRAHPGDAGLDLVYDGHAFSLCPGQRKLCKTGLSVAIPPGTVGMVCSRSGLALKAGVAVLNAPGIIDEQYRGDIGVILVNLGESTLQVNPGDKIAQLVHVPILLSTPIEVDSLDDTERGTGGFGSTGGFGG